MLTLFLALALLLPGSSILRQPEAAATPVSPLALPDPTGDLLVVRAYYTDREQVNRLAAWLEPWEARHDQGYLVVGVTSAEYALLQELGFTLEVDQVLTEQLNRPLASIPGQVSGIPGYPCYRTVDETYTTAQNLVNAYPALATWIDIGDSWEKVQPGGNPGYDLMVLKLTNQASPGPKPRLFAMGAVHAREYATAELLTRFAEYLLGQYNVNPDATWLLDAHEIHLLLQANPDGRKFAESGLLWRKNTNTNYCSPTSNYRGADLNRNFNFQWGCCGGSSTSPCAETYRGPSAASEPETQAIQAYLRQEFPDQRSESLSAPAPSTATGVFLDIHSYSELVLWPWGFTASVAPNGLALQTLGRKLAYFNSYAPSQAIDLYPTDGSTDDFAYGDLGLAAYTIELGNAFFEPCTSFLSAIYPTNLNALIYAAKVARTPYLTPAGPDTRLASVSPTSQPAGLPVQISATVDDTRYQPDANGSESTQNIAAAEYYIDLPPWAAGATAYPLQATDGSFNQKIEAVSATLNTIGLSTGRHLLYLRGRDSAGNWGAVTALFLEITPPLTPPLADFVAPARLLPGEPTTFINLSSGSQPLSFLWNFGDGSGTSTTSDPSYAYPSAGEYTVTLSATNPVGSSQAQHPLVVSPNRFQLTPPVASQSGPAGESLTYQVQIANTGLTQDTYQVDITGAWPVTLQAGPGYLAAVQSINLASGASLNLTVTVTIPAQASFGEAETTWITFSSQNETGYILTLRLFSYAEWGFYLPLVTR